MSTASPAVSPDTQNAELFSGACTVRSFWVRKGDEPKPRRVVLEGRQGDQFGRVRCIKTGVAWNTYGYPNFPEAGEVVMNFFYSLPA